MVSQWELRPVHPKFPASQLFVLPPNFTLVSCSAYSTLKMQAICSSETSADFQRTTWHYIPEDSTLKFYRADERITSSGVVEWFADLLYNWGCHYINTMHLI
jgi:hypothetical protein